MKKCAEIIFYSFVIAFFVCCSNETSKEIRTVPFEYNESFELSEHADDSPTLTFNFSLSRIETGNKNATDNINQAIAYTLFESDKNSIEEACKEFVAQRKKEYAEFLPEYLNCKKNGTPVVWFYNYYTANSEVEIGYKGYLNYTIMWEEFTGGAHPSSTYTVLNFNPETGEEIVLSDILKDNYEEPLTGILLKNLAEQLQVDGIAGIKEKGYLYQDSGMFISNNFILDKEQIVFIYNRYEIAPYALGDIMINVTYKELEELIK